MRRHSGSLRRSPTVMSVVGEYGDSAPLPVMSPNLPTFEIVTLWRNAAGRSWASSTDSSPDQDGLALACLARSSVSAWCPLTRSLLTSATLR